ncbi:MAG TPA: POTRA domain-containing protein [Myxococcota bacterium]|nr:POTRA domain-containing protein [Myxococcota bacterium]
MKLRLVVGVFLMALSFTAQAGERQMDFLRGRRVKSIHFEGKGLTTPEGLNYVEVHVGDRFSPRAVRRSVKLLYYMGLFGQVRALARAEGDGVGLTFELVRKRKVLSVGFFGNDVLDDDALHRLSRLERGDEYDRWKMEAAATDMLEQYRLHGYRRTQVVSKAEGPADGDVAVNYYFQEGPPTRISRFWFKGQLAFGTKRLERVMKMDQGDVLDGPALGKAIVRLRDFYRSRGYLEARIKDPKLDYDLQALWLVVPIEISSGPMVSYRFEGNQVLNSKTLGKEILSRKTADFNPFVLDDLSERLQDLYRRRGFARVVVTYRVERDQAARRKEIIFMIAEGNRVTVRDIDFQGNTAFSDEKLRAYIFDAQLDAIPQSLVNQPVDRGDLDPLGGSHPLSGVERRVNRPQGFLFELVPETVYLREPYEKALGKIGDLYRSQGYLEARVDPPLLSYDAGGSNLYITIPIHEGIQTRVESVSFEGNQFLSSPRLFDVAARSTGPVRPGGPLDLYGVEQLRLALVRTYAREGYIYCRIGQRIGYSGDRSLAEVVYTINEGPQVKVGRVLIRGSVLTDPAVFRHSLTLHAGGIFSPDQAAASREALYQLEIFSGVDIKLLDPEVPRAEKDIVVSVRERLPHSISISPGLSSAEGVRLQLGYSQRNLFGYALEFVGRAKVNYLVFYPLYSQWEDRYKKMSFWEGLEGFVLAGLHWPRAWALDMDLAARVDLLALQDHAISHDLTKVSIVPGVDLKLSDNLSFSTEFELEYDRLGCIGVECGGPTQKYLRYDEGSLLLGVLRPKLSWDKRDNIFSPHSGGLLAMRAELADNLLPDRQVLFLKLDGTATGYIPLGRAVTLAVSLRAGIIFNLSADSKTPSHKLFWLGGRNSVRGFEEEGLIPADQRNPDHPSSACVYVEEGDQKKCVSLGGNVLINFKSELRFPLIPDILQGAIFVDLGNLWVKPQNFNPFDLRPTAGLGLRLVTPVGPLAFDLAFNLDPDTSREEEVWMLHFNIGVF